MTTFTREDLIQAIYGQESSHGKADTSKENYAGARGPMQVTASTFDGLKNKGIIPQNFKHDNPEHTQEAGNRLVSYLFDKFGGDPKKVAASYYAGEKAVRADGTIANFRDLKNKDAPTTHQYVDSIMKRLGAASESLPTEAPTGDPVNAQRSSVLASWNEGMPDRSIARGERVPRALDQATAPIQPSPRADGEGVVPLADQVQVVEDALRKQSETRDNTSFLDQSRAAFIQNTFAGSAIRNRAMRQYEQNNNPDPAWQLDPKELAGYTEDEQTLLRTSNSLGHFEFIKAEIGNRRADLETVNIKGTGMGIAATLFAGLPEGYLTGMGAMKAFQLGKVGALQYAAQGRRGAALASAFAENVGSNLALTGLQDSFDQYVGATDYGMALGGALVGWGLTSPGLFSAASKGEIHTFGTKMADTAAAQTLALREQAVKNLGPDAAPELLQAEVRRLEANKLRQDLSATQAQVPANRRLMPESEELRIDGEVSAKEFNTTDEAASAIGDKVKPRFDSPEFQQNRIHAAQTSSKFRDMALKVSDGEFDYAKASELPGGVVVTRPAREAVVLRPAIDAIKAVAEKYLTPTSRVIVGASSTDEKALGEIISAGNVHFIGLPPKQNSTETLRTAMHEVGHAIFHEHAPNIPTELLERMKADHLEFVNMLSAGDEKAAGKRFSVTSKSRDTAPKVNAYNASFDEYTAEQFVKFMEAKSMAGDTKAGLPAHIAKMLKDAVNYVLDFFRSSVQKGYLSPDESFAEFFQRVLDGNLAQSKIADKVIDEAIPVGEVSSFSKPGDPDAIVGTKFALDNNLHLQPVESTAQQAEAKAVIDLYKKAKAGDYKVDEKRLSKLLDTAVFSGAQSTANIMLRSANPVTRMVAAELLESASGAAGRRSSAAIAKHMNEKAYLGNTLNEVQDAYRTYRNAQGETVVGDFFNGKQWEQFNRLVAEEIESRRPGAARVESPPAVKLAADSLEKAYDRMRVAQTDARTVGWGALPATSQGYMPHKMSPEKFINMTREQGDALHSALVDQFIQIEGFDITFSQHLATKYMDRVRVRAYGGFDAPMGAHQPGSAEIVEEALEQMGMDRLQITAMMKKYVAGGAGHTKKRLSLDLNAEHTLSDGSTFRLLDLFETDQFRLLRGQAQRVSGEVALARHGVMGKAGLKMLRRAMQFGADGERTTARELEAFDQVAAEFLGEPFGTQSKLVDRVMQVNSLARLGGMGFTQFGEAINGVFHVGALRTLDAVTSMGRLRSEIKALARGEKVDNPIIGSIERYSGTEFGTDQYKTVFPFDNPSLDYHTYGKDTLNAADRLLRGGAFVQGKLSLWRTIHSTQQRGMAEQIVRKAADYIKNGGNDVALRDMGMSDELIARLRKDIDSIAEFDGNKLTNFDITKATDHEAANEFIQSIHRGVSQIIQGTFIGETGKWTHDGMMRLMTQFRTFSLTSIEKQWARQVGNVGTAKTLGMMLGAMSIAAPIYMARTYLASIGRPDQEAYLEKQLTAAQIARASLNYIAMSGLAGDFLDATTAVTGVGKVTGGRTGVGSEFVGNVVAPAAGLADDVWRGLQNTKEGTDPHELAKALPFSKLPFMIPAINALGD